MISTLRITSQIIPKFKHQDLTAIVALIAIVSIAVPMSLSMLLATTRLSFNSILII